MRACVHVSVPAYVRAFICACMCVCVCVAAVQVDLYSARLSNFDGGEVRGVLNHECSAELTVCGMFCAHGCAQSLCGRVA